MVEYSQEELQNILDASVLQKKPHLFLRLYIKQITFDDWAHKAYGKNAHLEEMETKHLEECREILKDLRTKQNLENAIRNGS